MEARKFLKEYMRMCESMPCSLCELHGEQISCCLDDLDSASSDKDIDTVVGAVEKWSAEHPVITNFDKMVEIFGDETVDFLEGYLRFKCTDDAFRKEASAWLGEEYEERKEK